MIKRLTLFVIKAYKTFATPVLIPLLGHACRFTPSCSTYSYEAIEKYGIFKGSYLSVKRILRCHPFTKPGPDPLAGTF